MAAGVPIVATRTRGPVEILSDDTAYFAGVGDVDTLAQAIYALGEPSAAVEPPASVRYSEDPA